jgi:hypothetical protein
MKLFIEGKRQENHKKPRERGKRGATGRRGVLILSSS